jgi:hypothetical protein
VQVAYEGNHLEGDPVRQRAWRQRQIRIARAVLGGETLESVGKREGGLTVERIRQIVQVACVQARRLPDPKRRWPDHVVGGIRLKRKHKRFWRARFRSLERFWQLPDGESEP